jgi:hypothetical protein
MYFLTFFLKMDNLHKHTELESPSVSIAHIPNVKISKPTITFFLALAEKSWWVPNGLGVSHMSGSKFIPRPHACPYEMTVWVP